jgi:NADH dehydrogenase FAD-containing subunit
MTTSTTTPKQADLEDSELWQLAKKVSGDVREAFKATPQHEYYAYANSAMQNAVLVTSDIAMAIGKGKDASFDYRYARGHLLTVKGLAFIADELGYIQHGSKLFIAIKKLQAMIEKEIAQIDALDQGKQVG